MEQCYWILRHVRAWLQRHGSSLAAVSVSLLVLFGVNQVRVP
jgi:negative regulator of sigma E activity